MIHEYDGPLCGGYPDGDKVLKMQNKMSVSFSSKMSGVVFVTAKKALFKLFESCYPKDTMYTHIALLQLCAPTLDGELEMMTKIVGTFTSFEAFFSAFERRIYPDLKSILEKELREFSQGKEAARTYYLRYQELLHQCKKEPNDYILQFINGLADPGIREDVRKRPVGLHDDTLKNVAEHAIRIEETGARPKQGFNSNKNVAAVNKGKNGKGRGKGRGKNQGNKGANIAATSATTQVKSTTAPNSNANKEAKNEAEYNKKMKSFGFEACAGCFGNHKFDWYYKYCGKNAKCGFCNRFIFSQGGHASLDCFRRPASREEMISLLTKNGVI